MRRFLPGEPFGLVHVAVLQGDNGTLGPGCGAYINVGANFVMPNTEPDDVSWHDCILGFRVAQPDTRWALSEATLDRIVAVVDEQAGAWFDARTDPVETFRRTEREHTERPIKEWVGLVDEMCRCWVALGEPERAVATLRQKLDFFRRERLDGMAVHVPAFAASLGLDLQT